MVGELSAYAFCRASMTVARFASRELRALWVNGSPTRTVISWKEAKKLVPQRGARWMATAEVPASLGQAWIRPLQKRAAEAPEGRCQEVQELN